MTGELEKVWLDQTLNSSDVLHLLAKPYPAEKLAAYTVGREFTSGSEADDKEAVLRPQEYAELSDLSA